MHVVVLGRDGANSRVRVYDLAQPGLQPLLNAALEGPCLDVALSASGEHALVAGLTLFDLDDP